MPADRLRPSDTPAVHATRLCVIDLGTNSFHSLIVDVFPQGTYEVVDRIKEMVKLGDGLTDGQLSEAALERARQALRRVRLLAERCRVDHVLAYATSAIREAENGGDLIRQVQAEEGIRIRPIPGETEAELIYYGVRRAVDLSTPVLIVDIGGGSTEFIVADEDQAHAIFSLKLGAARLTEQFITTDPVEKAEFKALRATLRAQLQPVLEAARRHGVREVVGSSGTMENLGTATVHAHGDPSRSVYQQTVDPASFRKVTKALMRSSHADRAGMPGIDDKRMHQVVAGAILADVLVKDLPAQQLRFSPFALREGMVEEYIQDHRDRLAGIGRFRDVRRRSVHEVGHAFRWKKDHALHVATLTLRLFDLCASLHQRGPEVRELLEYAALLHDVGYHISHRKHHKHSLYLIQHADFRGFQPEEIALMANLARYHRRSVPKNKHAAYAALEPDQQRLVWELAALLRLAEGLDRSHFQNVTHLDAVLTDEAVSLTLTTRADPHLEVWGARHSADLFEAAYHRRVRIRAQPRPDIARRDQPVFQFREAVSPDRRDKLD